ncbi:hypothetical protein JG688_00009705 [Phytophthora aleatoria]|uniref:Uncharacterized protein n=1 Tax=Phytophthora aleatoria TaxID=2496075 RepID=A0A8J5IWZ6_9STRA|nr:hypothetical protein JG688_00009705 [Phytophthora aleatoria]
MVSFGSAAVDPAKIGSVSQGTLRVLPLAPVQTQAVQVLQCPWDMDDYAIVQIPAEDIAAPANRWAQKRLTISTLISGQSMRGSSRSRIFRDESKLVGWLRLKTSPFIAIQ